MTHSNNIKTLNRNIRNFKHEVVNALFYIDVNEDEIAARFPRLELLLRGLKNFKRSFEPLNVYEKVGKFSQGEKYVRFWRYTKIRGFKWKAKKVNNLIF